MKTKYIVVCIDHLLHSPAADGRYYALAAPTNFEDATREKVKADACCGGAHRVVGIVEEEEAR